MPFEVGETVNLRFVGDPDTAKLEFDGKTYTVGSGLRLMDDGGLLVDLRLPSEVGEFPYQFTAKDAEDEGGLLRTVPRLQPATPTPTPEVREARGRTAEVVQAPAPPPAQQIGGSRIVEATEGNTAVVVALRTQLPPGANVTFAFKPQDGGDALSGACRVLNAGSGICSIDVSAGESGLYYAQWGVEDEDRLSTIPDTGYATLRIKPALRPLSGAD